jgi:hypothetical protein
MKQIGRFWPILDQSEGPMSDLTSVIIFVGGIVILLTVAAQWRQLQQMRRRNSENAAQHGAFQKRILESGNLPVEQRAAFYEKALSDLKAPVDSGEQSNRELREENARLRAELSSRR